MKISTKYILASALSGILIFGSSCSDSWLQTEPTDQASNEAVLSTTEKCQKSNQWLM